MRPNGRKARPHSGQTEEWAMGNQREKANIRQILGIDFFIGDARGAVDQISRGGLLVVPSAPVLRDIRLSGSHRDALIHADLAITDSALMVLLWNLLEGDSIGRVSGLKYMRELLSRPDFRVAGNTLWIMPNPRSARRNLDWLASQGISVPEHCVYVAPIYGPAAEDPALIEHMRKHLFKHVVVTVGGGTQERLGLYIKRSLDYLPAIHCIGAAIAFLSGDQVKIPGWVDELYLGWLIRCLWAPRRYVPRYWTSFSVVTLLWRYRHKLPPMQAAPAS
jgi:N-acetylglucosaminyldiphosphoundecaprenol N-acetyl-beta-D-mannosaminyltransferase